MPSLGAKIIGVLLYMIPWADSLKFGNHLYMKYMFVVSLYCSILYWYDFN